MKMNIELDGVAEGEKYIIEVSVTRGEAKVRSASPKKEKKESSPKDEKPKASTGISIDDFEDDELAQLNKNAMSKQKRKIESNINL